MARVGSGPTWGGLGGRGYAAAMVGAVLVVVGMIVVGPFLLFVAGALWSALLGQVLTADAERRDADSEYLSQRLW